MKAWAEWQPVLVHQLGLSRSSVQSPFQVCCVRVGQRDQRQGRAGVLVLEFPLGTESCDQSHYREWELSP